MVYIDEYYFSSMLFLLMLFFLFFFFSSRRRHTRCSRDWSSDVCSSDLEYISTKGSHASRVAHRIIASMFDWYTSAFDQMKVDLLYAEFGGIALDDLNI